MIEIKEKGVSRQLVGLEIKDVPMPGPNTRFWEIKIKDNTVGKVTSAVYSPRLKKNIALAMIEKRYSKIGTEVQVISGADILSAEVVKKPFFDPAKTVTKS